MFNETEKLLKPKEARKYFNASDETLRRWVNNGEIECVRTGGSTGHRRYKVTVREEIKVSQPTKYFVYARVSTREQKEDLERQVNVLKTQFPNYRVIKDIGSGLNFKRKGLKTILDEAINGNIKELVVTDKDRLCRFGFEMLEYIIKSRNGTIVVLNQNDSSPEKEIVDDVLSIITVFSARVHGRRSHRNKRNQVKNVENNRQGSGKIQNNVVSTVSK